LALGSALLLLPAACDTSVEPDDGGTPEPYSHIQPAGASAPDFLSGDRYDALVVEVDYMPGYAPEPGALDQLEVFLAARLNKAAITIRTPTEIPAGGSAAYTLSDIRNLEDEHRDALTEDSTLAAYILIVDGEFEQSNVIGVAHLNTSSAYFGAALDAVSGGLLQPSREVAEATVFQHEFGHLFGLVNIPGSGTDMQTDHQDEAHGHHCDDDQCLMYYALETTDLFANILGSEVPELDANCRADLAANGGK
jgi:hypothetical protein